ncbi:hypothetical protein LJ737_07185 [Hymenobacter sp. 15J16-1T3B]|uniref:hypothetical protein n=1 Tax=Hymenobacter sp. 15J16-1T3B TaxID=2886941 RepID=UPI001D10F208|nr:hypothetical protein [Hymenobacter sp. 15J16-1T3B]MCC3157015.1 hypothetical protein [Hymenobacter sp. 15J16-1T3B]
MNYSRIATVLLVALLGCEKKQPAAPVNPGAGIGYHLKLTSPNARAPYVDFPVGMGAAADGNLWLGFQAYGTPGASARFDGLGLACYSPAGQPQWARYLGLGPLSLVAFNTRPAGGGWLAASLENGDVLAGVVPDNPTAGALQRLSFGPTAWPLVRRAPVPTADGGCLVAFEPSGLQAQLLLLKLNAQGAAQWANRYTLPIGLELPVVAATADGGAWVLGCTSMGGPFTLLKIAATGALERAQLLTSSPPPMSFTMRTVVLRALPNGGCLTGWGTSAGACLTTYAANGDQVSSKVYQIPGLNVAPFQTQHLVNVERTAAGTWLLALSAWPNAPGATMITRYLYQLTADGQSNDPGHVLLAEPYAGGLNAERLELVPTGPDRVVALTGGLLGTVDSREFRLLQARPDGLNECATPTADKLQVGEGRVSVQPVAAGATAQSPAPYTVSNFSWQAVPLVLDAARQCQ